MSKFLSKSHLSLKAYVPGEQPTDKRYIKLNTNESPFPPSKKAIAAVKREATSLNLYSDPSAKSLKRAIAKYYGVQEKEVTVTNGSDEALAFCFMAFCDSTTPMAFFDVTYGFYKVYAELFGIPSEIVKLKDDFTADFDGLKKTKGNVIIANPNAQTGIFESLEAVEDLIKSKKDKVVIIDEAYCDFGGESAANLVKKYENAIVVSTFSKSRNLAGGRIGFVIANENLILDIEKMKYSFNPYSLGRIPLVAAKAAIEDVEYFKECVGKIKKTREYTVAALKELGFEVLPSLANFVLCKTDKKDGESLYLALKEKGILCRYLGEERIKDYVRITIGTKKQMRTLIDVLGEIL